MFAILSEYSWEAFAVFGMLSFTVMQLLLKYITGKTDPFSITVLLIGGVALLFVLQMVAYDVPFPAQMPVLVGICAAAVLNAVGHYCELVGVKYAPNPGYIASLKSGQIVVIVFASLFLFEDMTLTATKLVAIVAIVVGIVGVTNVGKKTQYSKERGVFPWPVYGLVTLFAFAGVTLIFRYLNDAYIIDVVSYNAGIWTVTLVLLLSWGYPTGQKVKASWMVFVLVFVAAFFGFVGNYLDYTAVGWPGIENPGYATAIKGAQAPLGTLLAPMLLQGVTLDAKRQLPFIVLAFCGVVVLLVF